MTATTSAPASTPAVVPAARTELPVTLPRKLDGCRQCERGTPVDHDGVAWCRSGSLASGGSRAHCTCDSCF